MTGEAMMVSCLESGRLVCSSDTCRKSLWLKLLVTVSIQAVVSPVSDRVLGIRIVREVVVSIEPRSLRRLGMRERREVSDVEAILVVYTLR